MSIIDYIIIGIVIMLFLLALRYSWENKGNCSSDCKNCKKCFHSKKR